MASSFNSRLGTAPEEGCKAPVKTVANSPITLSGEQTIGSVAVVAGDRVLVNGQTDTAENGIYDVSTSAWSYAKDWNKSNDVIAGMLVPVSELAQLYQLQSFTGDYVAGTTAITFTVLPATATTGITHTESGTDYLLSTYLSNRYIFNLRDSGALGDNSTVNTSLLSGWLDDVIAANAVGYIPEGVFLSDAITKAVNNGIRLYFDGTIKATGSNKLNFLRFTGARGRVIIAGPGAVDGNNIVARPLEIENTGATPSTLGEVYTGDNFRVINAKSNSSDNYTVAGIRVHGGFSLVNYGSTIDGCDSENTSTAASIGLWTSWVGSGDDWVRRTHFRGSAKILNVKNDNASTKDADGCQITAPTDKVAYVTMENGAYFENCEGRSVKAQVQGGHIGDIEVYRSLYPGIIEVDCQYAGVSVGNIKVHHEAQYCTTAIVSVTQRLTPRNVHGKIDGPELRVTGTPSQWTNAMVQTTIEGVPFGSHDGSSNASVLSDSSQTWTTNAYVGYTIYNTEDGSSGTITANTATTVTATLTGGTDNDWDAGDKFTILTHSNQGVSIKGLRVEGTIEDMITTRNHNIIDKNRLIIQDCWAESINNVFLNRSTFGNSRGQITVVMENNGCDNGCTGSVASGSSTGDVIVERSSGNYGITALPNMVHTITSAGALTVYSEEMKINTNGGAGTDNLDQFIITDQMRGRTFTCQPSNDARTVVIRDGQNNIYNDGNTDFSMNSIRDRSMYKHDEDSGEFLMVSSSNNGT